MLDTGREDKRLDGTVLLDLPDHDSTEVSHHLEVDRLVKLADLLVWVLDPQKYADAAIHDRYLKPLAGHADVMLVVLNHIDTVPEDRRDAMLADVRRLLDLDGLGKVPVLGISARHGIGMEALKDEMAKRASSKKATRAKLEADVKDVAAAMAAVSGSGKPSNASKDRAAELEEAFADAAGVPLVVDAVAASTRLRARRATGWPVTAWLSRLKPDPLKRLHLDLGKEGRALTRASRTSVPPATQVQRARVDAAVRGVADDVGTLLTRPWQDAVRRASVAHLDDISDRLDLTLAQTDLGAGEAAVVGRPGPGAAVGADPRRGRGRGLAGIAGGDGLPPGSAAVAAFGGRDPGADAAAGRGSGARDPARAVLPSARPLHGPGARPRRRQAAALPGSAAWSPTWSPSRSTRSSRPTTRSGTGSTTRFADRPSGYTSGRGRAGPGRRRRTTSRPAWPPVTVGLRPSVEADSSVGGVLDEVAVVVDAVVVPGAEQHAVGEVGAASATPGVAGVVGFAPGGRHRAAVGAAGALADGEGLALRGGEESSGAAEVEDLGVPVEDGGEDGGTTGQPAGF